MKKTKPQVFIVESLRFSDEGEGISEGRRIFDMLALSGKECRYVYIRTKVELEEVLEQFWDSRYRYLHFSCHANANGMDTTLDHIPYEELTQLLEPYLEKRRLFLSACRMSRLSFAKGLILRADCMSVLGPSAKVDMADAAIFWAAFYHKMFRINSEAMKHVEVLDTARMFSSAFSIPLNLFRLRIGRCAHYSIRPK